MVIVQLQEREHYEVVRHMRYRLLGKGVLSVSNFRQKVFLLRTHYTVYIKQQVRLQSLYVCDLGGIFASGCIYQQQTSLLYYIIILPKCNVILLMCKPYIIISLYISCLKPEAFIYIFTCGPLSAQFHFLAMPGYFTL